MIEPMESEYGDVLDLENFSYMIINGSVSCKIMTRTIEAPEMI